jgi:VWFA-related protein
MRPPACRRQAPACPGKGPLVKTAVIALAVVVAAASGLSSFATLAQSSTQPVFRSSARLVQVSVVVQDRNGQPVPGLTAADFEVVEGGKKHQVAHFAVQSREGSGGASAPMPAGAFTNVLDGRIGTGATIVLFDRLNTSDIDQIYARRHLVTFLRQLKPDERLGFYVLDGRSLRIIHDFTRDTEALLRLIDGVSKTTSAELAGSEEKLDRPPAMGDGLDQLFEALIEKSELAMNGFFIEKRADATVETLEILAERLAGVQGRKNVIWISSAFPLYFNDGISLQQMSPRVYRATRALSHADVSIYPVDARGLIGGLSGPAGRPTFTTMAQLAPSFDTSSLIADQTGGRVFRNTNDLGAAMQRAVTDADLTYVLGYYPQDERFDGRFRKIEVKVKKANVSVRHRQGYYAHPPKVAAGLEKDGLIEALQYPIEATGLGVTVTPSAAANGEIALTLRIDPAGLSLESRDGHWKGQLEVAIGQRLPDNKLQNSAHVVVPLDIPEAMREALMASGLTLNRSVTLNPLAHLLVVGVRDLKSGAIGTVRIETARLKH